MPGLFPCFFVVCLCACVWVCGVGVRVRAWCVDGRVGVLVCLSVSFYFVSFCSLCIFLCEIWYVYACVGRCVMGVSIMCLCGCGCLVYGCVRVGCVCVRMC